MSDNFIEKRASINDEYNYKVFPIISEKRNIITHSEMSSNVTIAALVCLVIGIICFLASSQYWVFFGAVSLALYGFAHVIQREDNETASNNEMEERSHNFQKEARELSIELNALLKSTQELISGVLPFIENKFKITIDKAVYNFKDGVHSPFWLEIENATNVLGDFNEAYNDFTKNAIIYTKSLEGKSHNFPIPFPISKPYQLSQDLFTNYNDIIRNAQRNPHYSIIWEQRRTNRILHSGFRNLEDAVERMGNEIISSIDRLGSEISSGFQDLKDSINYQTTAINNQTINQGYNTALINSTLESMNNKLYYIEYNRRPNEPFSNPWASHNK